MLENVLTKIDNCGKNSIELLYSDGHFKEVPIYCNNRICENPSCKDHRGYLFKKNHSDQITITQKSMRKPRAWVFTYGNILYPIDRKLCQQLMLKLYHLLNGQSITNFSIHMELKLHDGHAYLHFHVLCGGVKDLRFTRKLWGKQVLQEQALYPEQVVDYVSKYASKTPTFPTEMHRIWYLYAVYKLQMHKFSAKHIKILEEQIRYESSRYSFTNPNLQAIYDSNTRKHNSIYLKDKPPPKVYTTEALLIEIENSQKDGYIDNTGAYHHKKPKRSFYDL